jgi:hypothetical protein
MEMRLPTRKFIIPAIMTTIIITTKQAAAAVVAEKNLSDVAVG